jgi:hypothetical protein
MLAPKCSKLLLSRILPSMLSLIRCHKECKHTYVSFGSQLMLIWPNNWLSTRHGEFDWIGANIWHADGMVLVQLEKLGATPLLRLVAPYATAAYLSPHRLWPPRRKTCNLVPHGWKFVKQADASIIISKIWNTPLLRPWLRLPVREREQCSGTRPWLLSGEGVVMAQ